MIKNRKLYIMSGIPGSGKSTFIFNHMNKDTDIVVSRDAIRFSMVSEDEEYFSKEKAVFREFTNQINKSLEMDKNVWADATHLNRTSRNKLLRAVVVNPTEVNIIWVKTPIGQCFEQNENRKGTRSYVPKNIIHNMNCSFEKPEFEEGFDKIYIIEPNKPIMIKERRIA